MDYLDIKNPLKSKRPKSFKFLQKKDKEEKEKEEKKEEKKKKDDKDDKKKEKKRKEEKKLREKEEKKRRQKDKKKKTIPQGSTPEDCTIFGVPLSIAVERNPSHDGIRLPVIVRECIDFIEEKGLNCDGIYRIGGVKSKVQSLRRAYNAGETVQLDDQQPQVVASLLKQYLRELPETVLTVDMMPHFEDVSLIPNPRERAEALRQLIDRLPTTNRLLLQYVLKHMGHVIEREKDTKMSYHNVCVILSPTMQISHRVLNVMFHSQEYLFGNVQIKKYLPPITSFSGAKRSIEDLSTLSEIEEEIMKQESLLSCLHSAIAAGRISQKREEQLWEAQRILTLLKRKLKNVHRKEIREPHKTRSHSCHEKAQSVEEAFKEETESTKTFPVGAKILSENEEEEEKKTFPVIEMKSSSETDTAGTPSFKTASNEGASSRKSSEGDSDRSQPNSSSLIKKEESSKNQVIPILPKPFSARAERNKMAQVTRVKSVPLDSVIVNKRKEEVDDSHSDNVRNIVHMHHPPNTIDFPGKSKKVLEKEVQQKFSKMSEIQENEVSGASSRHRSVHLVRERRSRAAVHASESRIRGADPRFEKPCSSRYNEDTDFCLLEKEMSRLRLEHEELLSMNHELMRKLQLEKTEISRLRDEIQEMQTLYGYRTHSYDSSESEGSESDGDSDTEEEILRQIVSLNRTNKNIKCDNISLTKQIQNEREAIIKLKVALRQVEMHHHRFPQEVAQTC